MRLWRRRPSANGRDQGATVAAATVPSVLPRSAAAQPLPPRPVATRHRGDFVRSVRRFLVIQALMLWQGGFLFYTAFVVPTGGEVLGSAAAQGAITARVTEMLNLLGIAGIGLLAWDLAASRDPASRRTAARWWCWAALLVCQYLLLVVHEILVSLMDPGRAHVMIRPPFYPLHRLYLWASTAQWFAGVLLVWWTLRAWADEPAANTITDPEC
jgi:hypothetical protein